MSNSENFTSPFSVVRSRYITEKTMMLGQLHSAESNACLRKCQTPKYVFIVHKKANKNKLQKLLKKFMQIKS